MFGETAEPEVADDLQAGDESGSTDGSAPLEGLSAGPIHNVHDVFTNWWRRAILYYVREGDAPVDLTAMTRQLIVWYRGSGTPADVEQALVERTRRMLRQAHVLELRAADMLGYDSESDAVWIPDDVSVSVPPPWE